MTDSAAVLGTNYGNDVRPVWDAETGEIRPIYDPLQKWHMQAAAREALSDDPHHRLHICMRHRRADRSEVGVRRSDASGKTYFDGVMTCGSIWTCSVCAAKIQAIRTNEVKQAIATHLSQGGFVAMVTLTFRHELWDRLGSSLKGFKSALSSFRSGRFWQGIQTRYGVSGSITGLEVTWGESGWHPHAHVLLFLKSAVDLPKLQAELIERWSRCIEGAGIGWVGYNGLVVSDASKVRSYLTKYVWGPQDELVRSHTKRGRGSGLTPFDMLRRYVDDPEGNAYLLKLFREFATVFFGSKQLTWSRGLKKLLLGSEGATDEEIAASVGEQDPLLASIPFPDWRIIKHYNLQGHVLRVADEFGAEGIDYLLGPYRKRHRERLSRYVAVS